MKLLNSAWVVLLFNNKFIIPTSDDWQLLKFILALISSVLNLIRNVKYNTAKYYIKYYRSNKRDG